jgi:transposase
MTQSTVAPVDRIVTVGVDTHSDIHVAVALDQLGRRLGTITIATAPQGYRQLEAWARRFGRIEALGIEGTGSWGAGLVCLLREHGHRLVEVNRPDRGARRQQGQTDPLDAEAAARAVLAGTASAQPKAGEGWWR